MNIFRPNMLIVESPATSQQLCSVAERKGFNVVTPQRNCRESIVKILEVCDMHALFMQHRLDFTAIKKDFLQECIARIPESFHDRMAIVLNIPLVHDVEESIKLHTEDGATAIAQYHARLGHSLEPIEMLFDNIWKDWNPHAGNARISKRFPLD